MRNLYLLLSLLIMTAYSTEARNRFEYLEGRFVNPYFGDQIKVRSIRGGIKVKGLNGIRGWQKFYTYRGELLQEAYGRRMIDVVGPHRVIIKRTRGSRGLHYIRKPRRGNRCNLACCTTDWNRYDRYDRRNERYYDFRNGYGRNDRYDYDDRNRNNRNRDRRSRDYSIDLTPYLGEWYSGDVRKLVIIEKSGNNDIKARVSGSNQWTVYQYDGRRWKDKRGNTYTLEDSDTLTWRRSDGREVLRLERS